jgi:hypothetical protein
MKAEARVRQKWLVHSVGCESALADLMEALSVKTKKRSSSQPLEKHLETG